MWYSSLILSSQPLITTSLLNNLDCKWILRHVSLRIIPSVAYSFAIWSSHSFGMSGVRLRIYRWELWHSVLFSWLTFLSHLSIRRMCFDVGVAQLPLEALRNLAKEWPIRIWECPFACRYIQSTCVIYRCACRWPTKLVSMINCENLLIWLLYSCILKWKTVERC